MTTFDPRLLTPPQEEEEIYPYRRVWRSIAIENSVLLGGTGLLFALTNFLNVQLPPHLNRVLGVGLALFPLVLWLLLSWWQERFVPQPRQRLLSVMLTSALVANAIGVPLVNDFFQIERWLPLSSAISRILGYTFTVGIVQATFQYLVVRYIAWPDSFRIRLDGIAYGAAAAIGYTTVLNLHYVLSGTPPDAASIRIFDTIATSMTMNFIIGYGLAELRFGAPTPLLLTVTIALAALVTGIAIPVRAGLVNATLSIPSEKTAYGITWISATKPLLGLGFSIVLLVGFSLALAFLFSSAERREREAIASREA